MDADPATDGNQTYTGGVLFGTVFTLKFTFSHPVDGFNNAANDVEFTAFDANNVEVNTARFTADGEIGTSTSGTDVVAVTPMGGTASTTEYTVTLAIGDSAHTPDATPPVLTTITKILVEVKSKCCHTVLAIIGLKGMAPKAA